MEILSDTARLGEIDGAIDLAIGVFDGVHRGHAAVVGSAVAGGRTPVVVTFDPHPVRLLRPDKAPPQLTRMSHKASLLGELGIGFLLPVKFDEARSGQEAGAFVRELTSGGNVASISVGAGFRFGKGRQGDFDLLRTLGGELGFQAFGLEAVCDDTGEAVSSTRVRAALGEGALDAVEGLLGRRYSILATVTKGRQLGRTIGFPTANLPDLPGALPPFGVYAVRVGDRAGIANLGLRPTVEGDRTAPLLEVHLFDFNDEIYGEELDVEFVSFVRPETKFDGIDALKAQIAKDVAAVRAGV